VFAGKHYEDKSSRGFSAILPQATAFQGGFFGPFESGKADPGMTPIHRRSPRRQLQGDRRDVIRVTFLSPGGAKGKEVSNPKACPGGGLTNTGIFVMSARKGRTTTRWGFKSHRCSAAGLQVNTPICFCGKRITDQQAFATQKEVKGVYCDDCATQKVMTMWGRVAAP